MIDSALKAICPSCLQRSRIDRPRIDRSVPLDATRRCLDCGFAALIVADADGLFDAPDEDLSVADVAGASGAQNCVDGLLPHLVVDRHLDLDLGEKVDGVFAAAVELGVALLPAVSTAFQDGDSLDAGFGSEDMRDLEYV
jgi:hypothetical protein